MNLWLSPGRRRKRSDRRRWGPWLLLRLVALVAVLSVVGLAAGPRGFVALSGLAAATLYARWWWRDRRLINARTLGRLLALTPDDFERQTERLLRRMGFRLGRVGGTGDGGIDLFGASPDGPVLVQCKRYHGSVGAPHVRDFYGALSKSHAARGFFITTGLFTSSARSWAEDVAIPLALIDGPALVTLVRRHLAPEVLPFWERGCFRSGVLVLILAAAAIATFLTPGPEGSASYVSFAVMTLGERFSGR